MLLLKDKMDDTEEVSEDTAVQVRDNSDKIVADGVVLYTDGGCKPSRGFGGYGVHGYFYNNEVPKQGSGSKEPPTAVGYKSGASKDSHVTIVSYVDFWSAIEGETTNNVAELLAAIQALELVLLAEVKTVTIMVDSIYVRDGLSKWHKKWIKNNWMREDGTMISNRAEWEALISLKDQVTANGIKLQIEWVKGHSGALGNVQADSLASRGVVAARKGVGGKRLTYTEPKGYWSYSTSHNRLLSKSCWYFLTGEFEQLRKDGLYTYHMGKHGPKTTLLGKAAVEASYAVVFSKTQDPVLEHIREYQNQVSDEGYQRVVIANLDTIHQPKHYQEITEDGHTHLDVYGNTKNLVNCDGAILTEEVNPTRLAYRALETLNSLEKTLEEYLAGGDASSHMVFTDITEIIYEKEADKKGKIKCKLKPDIGVTTKYIDCKANYDTKAKSGVIDLRLVMDVDMPSRNALSALTGNSPIIKVATQRMSDDSLIYFTFVETDLGVGIWSSVHANLRLITD